jgi:hypothetical protein
MSTEAENLAAINEYMRLAGVAAVAAACRRDAGQLVVPEEYGAPWLALPAGSDAEVGLREPVRPRATRGPTTVHAVPVNAPAAELAWWREPWVMRAQLFDLAIGAGLGAIAGVWYLVDRVVTATAHAVDAHAGQIEGVVVLIVVLALCTMLGGRSGGGTRISGTFEGTLHK